MENARLAKVTFPHALLARSDALRAEAPKLSLDLYTKAERELSDAARTIEKGDVKKGKERGLRAEKKFREAELSAIKLTVLGDLIKKLEKVRKTDVVKLAPQSFARAVKLADKTEELLDRDRSAIPDASDMVEDALYHLRHAAYVTTIVRELKEDDANWERLILKHEGHVANVVKEFSYEPQFDKGLEPATASLITAINSVKQENRRLNSDLTKMQVENETLQVDMDNIKQELNASRKVQAGLMATIDSEKRLEQKYQRATELFLPREAKVLRIDDALTIRLIGLNFQSGRAIIQPEYFNLLSKVQRAIRIFPEFQVVVEGHTDNVGDGRYNKRLSIKRANAVRAYIMASMGLPDSKVSAVGYGETKPIGSNDNSIGRKQNRRIDIILKPKPTTL